MSDDNCGTVGADGIVGGCFQFVKVGERTLGLNEARELYRQLGDRLVEEKLLTEEDAAHARDTLSRFYRSPVMPMGAFCKALSTWANAIVDLRKAEPRFDGDEPKHRHGAEYAEVLFRIITDIRKSNLLYRPLYAGEKLRTKPCPVHKGRWSGLEFSDNRCPHGCGHTGWLPES